MSGYTDINGQTGVVLDCSQLVWHDSENHGREINVPLKEHCLVISFDGKNYYMHLVYIRTNSDVTRPQIMPMFDDYMRSGKYDERIFRVFSFMLRKAIKIEGKDNSSEDLSYDSGSYIDRNSNNDPTYAPDRNPNIDNDDYYSNGYARGDKDVWQNDMSQYTSRGKNKNYRW